jgi:hypothetical protein
MGEIAEEKMYKYLDGPRFCDWLESEGVNLSHLPDSQIRRVREWRTGSRADIYSGSVDKIMTDNLLAISSIPDEAFSENQQFKINPGTANKLPEEERVARKERAEKLLIEGGMTVIRIAEETGVSMTTIGKWKRSLRRRGIIPPKD